VGEDFDVSAVTCVCGVAGFSLRVLYEAVSTGGIEWRYGMNGPGRDAVASNSEPSEKVTLPALGQWAELRIGAYTEGLCVRHNTSARHARLARAETSCIRRVLAGVCRSAPESAAGTRRRSSQETLLLTARTAVSSEELPLTAELFQFTRTQESQCRSSSCHSP
jgi:hypothetical protein